MQNKIIHFETIDSTNTYGLSNFENLQDKTVIIADEQTKGRGRFDRIWVSENYDNIYLSFILKPEHKKYITNLTQEVGHTKYQNVNYQISFHILML